MKRLLLQFVGINLINCFFMSAMAQQLPPFVGGSSMGDTIIYHGPGLESGKHNPKMPSRMPTVTAVYYNGYVAISVVPEVPFSYVLSNNENATLFRREIVDNSNTPILVETSSLPPGHYTLRLYINNECLEGEFEKE